MTDLQTAFYIVSLVFMGVILAILLALVSAVFVIRAKINAIHEHIEEKLGYVTEIAEKGGAVIGTIKKAVRSHK